MSEREGFIPVLLLVHGTDSKRGKNPNSSSSSHPPPRRISNRYNLRPPLHRCTPGFPPPPPGNNTASSLVTIGVLPPHVAAVYLLSRTAHHRHIRPTAAARKELAGKIQGCRRGIKQRQRGGAGCFWTAGVSGKEGCGSRFKG
ncbi:hypothetical protein LXL04_005701 [Taraxacum kok-saghyz]